MRFLPRYYVDRQPEATHNPAAETQESQPNHDPLLDTSTGIASLPVDAEPDTICQNNEPPPEPVRIQLSEELSAALTASFSRSVEFMVVGRIRGKCPGPRRLYQWALSRLHKFLH